MGIMCLLGLHRWQGCKCSACGKTRDKGHDWTRDCERCEACGTTRAEAHVWNGCRCSACGMGRDEGHQWIRDRKCPGCQQTELQVTLRTVRIERREEFGEVCRYLTGRTSTDCLARHFGNLDPSDRQAPRDPNDATDTSVEDRASVSMSLQRDLAVAALSCIALRMNGLRLERYGGGT